RAAARDLAKRAAELAKLQHQTPPLPCAHGVQEGGPRFSIFPGVQDARIHVRGSYERLGDRVPRGFPKVLAGDKQPAITTGSGRLELARWIGSARKPLTSRGLRHPILQQNFVERNGGTPGKFGPMGPPANPPGLTD